MTSKKTLGAKPLVLGDGGGSSAAFAGPFRKNLKDFFRLHGEKVSFAQMKHVHCHMIPIRYKAQDGSSTDLKLHFYTELVGPESNNVVCDECRIMGWQHHAVGCKRVHVILPSEKTLGNPRTLMSLMEMRHRGWMHRARLDASKIQREKEEDYGDGTSEFVAAENMFYSKSHLLHGVFHMNGFGHLCRVNGREGGSSMYSGTELMRVWDELCSVLRTRMVSVEDVSNKLTMELRILLPLSYGNTWYGRWGYEFGRSPFNVQAEQWHAAVKSAASVRIADLIDACCQVTNGNMKPRRGWKAVLAVLQRYHNAPLLADKPVGAGADLQQTEGAVSCPQDNKVLCMGDLLRAMLDALRSPSDAWFTLLVARGACGQRPKEELAPDLKGSQIKESALLAAFHAQGAPPPIPAESLADDLYIPESESKPGKKRKTQPKSGAAPAPKAEGKRAKNSAPAEPAAKRVKASAPSEAQGKKSKSIVPSEAQGKKAKTSVPAEAQGKKSKASAPAEAQGKKAKATANTVPEVSPVKKAPKLKIRKRPRSATVLPVATALPVDTAQPISSSQPVAASSAELAAFLSQPVAAAEPASLWPPLATMEAAPLSQSLVTEEAAAVPQEPVTGLPHESGTALPEVPVTSLPKEAPVTALPKEVPVTSLPEVPVAALPEVPVTTLPLPTRDPLVTSLPAQPAVTAPPLSQPQPPLTAVAALVPPFQPSGSTEPEASASPVNTAPLTDAEQFGNCDPDDPGPVKKQARGMLCNSGDVEHTPLPVALIAADAFAQPSSLDQASKNECLANDAGTLAPAVLDCVPDQGGRSKRSRQPSVRLARFDFDERQDKPRRNGVSARQCHDDMTWKPGISTKGVRGTRNGCDAAAATERKLVRKRTPSAKAELASGKAGSSVLPMCTDEEPVAASTQAKLSVKAGRPAPDAKVSKSSAEGKAGKATAELKGNKQATAGRASQSPVGRWPLAKSPVRKSPVGKSPVGKSPAGKGAATKSPAKSTIGKPSVGMSTVGKSAVAKALAGKSPVKGRGGKSPACDSDSDRPSLKSNSVLATVGAAVSSAVPPSSAENAPSEAMKLWCRNVDRLSPGGCIHESCATTSTLKSQIMADLMCLYFTFFRTDVSENLNIHYSLLPNITAWSGANLTKPPPPSNHAAVAQLRSALCTLRYTKHFVKDYRGALPAAGRPVKALQPRTAKKKTTTAATPEVRVLVTVLVGFSFDRFGGPEAVDEGNDKDVNGAEGVDKRTRPRSHRILAAETGAWPAETVSTQAADTDDAEVAFKTLRSSPCCDGTQEVHTDCEAPGTSAEQAVGHNRATCSQQLPAEDAEQATEVDAAACELAAANDAEAPRCSPDVDGGPSGDAVADPSTHDAAMSPNAGDTAPSEEGVPPEVAAKARSTNQEGAQQGTEGTTALAGEAPLDICVASGRGADGATDTANSQRTEPMMSTAAEGACQVQPAPQTACRDSVGHCSVERHNSSNPADLNQHAADDQADVQCKHEEGAHAECQQEKCNQEECHQEGVHEECKQEEGTHEEGKREEGKHEQCHQEGCKHEGGKREEFMEDTGSREQPCDTAGCEAAACDGKVHTVGDAPSCRQGVGESPTTEDFSHAEELYAALHDPSVLAPRLRPPPAELITCQVSTTVGDFRRQIAAALKDTYQIFSKFRVDWLHYPLLEANDAHAEDGGDSSRLFWLGNDPPDKAKIDQYLPLSSTEPVHIVVAGPGLDLDNAKLRHAGGEADWVVSCPCGVTDDDGERMLCCDKCGQWVHSYCEGIADSQPDPTKFTCSQCTKPRSCA